MPRPGEVALSRLIRALVAVLVLMALTGMVWMNVRLSEQARDLNRPMPCSSDNDAACRSGFVR